MTITHDKKIARYDKGVCIHCGKKPCLCKVPKAVARRVNDAERDMATYLRSSAIPELRNIQVTKKKGLR